MVFMSSEMNPEWLYSINKKKVLYLLNVFLAR